MFSKLLLSFFKDYCKILFESMFTEVPLNLMSGGKITKLLPDGNVLYSDLMS